MYIRIKLLLRVMLACNFLVIIMPTAAILHCGCDPTCGWLVVLILLGLVKCTVTMTVMLLGVVVNEDE